MNGERHLKDMRNVPTQKIEIVRVSPRTTLLGSSIETDILVDLELTDLGLRPDGTFDPKQMNRIERWLQASVGCRHFPAARRAGKAIYVRWYPGLLSR